jgi:hypothetical protein
VTVIEHVCAGDTATVTDASEPALTGEVTCTSRSLEL